MAEFRLPANSKIGVGETYKAAAGTKNVDPARATLDGKSVAYLRTWLRDKGAELVHDNPEFTALWDGVLSGEVRDDG